MDLSQQPVRHDVRYSIVRQSRRIGMRMIGPTRCWPRRTIAAGLLAGCVFSNKALSVQQTYRAEEFFTGRKLKLAKAIEAGDMRALRELASGEDLAAPADKNMTLLWFAIQQRNFDAIKTLVQLGVDPDTQIAQGIGSALRYAFLQKDLRFLKAMLDGGLSPNHQSPENHLMLQRAILDGSLEHVKMLVERGADIDQRDSIGGSALYESIATRQPEIAIFLIEKGADFKVKTVNGVTIPWAVHRSISRLQSGPMLDRFEELRALLIKKGVHLPPDSPEVVREQMRRQGLRVVVPAGKER